MKANPARRDLNRMTRAFAVDRSISLLPMTRARARSFASTSFESYGNRGKHAAIRLMSNSNLTRPEPIGISQRSSVSNCGQFEMLIMLLLSATTRDCLRCSSPPATNGAQENSVLNVFLAVRRSPKQIEIAIRPLGQVWITMEKLPKCRSGDSEC
jgi:hypothetical protein